MLPVILGGIALTAAGFKLKEYCDQNGKGCDALNDGLLWISDKMEEIEDELTTTEREREIGEKVKEYVHKKLQNPLYPINQFRLDIFNSVMEPFGTYVSQIAYFGKIGFVYKIPKVKEEQAKHLTDKTKKALSTYVQILQEAKEALQVLMPQIEEMARHDKSRKVLDKDQIAIVNKAAVFATVTANLLEAKILKKDGSLAKNFNVKVLEATKILIEANMTEDVLFRDLFQKKNKKSNIQS